MKKLNLHLKKGALHKQLGVPEGQQIPLSMLHNAMHNPPDEKLRKRLQFALNAKKWNHG